MKTQIKNRNRSNKTSRKYDTVSCNNDMSFEECELTILRAIVDLGTEQEGQNLVRNKDIQKMILMLEKWLRKKGNMCYGGTALNAVLPKHAQFYNRDVEIPDYDFFSPNALKDAVELSRYYHDAGFQMVEAKSGVHHGTFKVYVNFIPLADITQMEPVLYKNMQKESLKIGGIRYAPIHFLRLACFTELSRPKGDVSRWEKVFKRLTLLNKYYPLKSSVKCKEIHFQRPMEMVSVLSISKKGEGEEDKEDSKKKREEAYDEIQTQIYDWTRQVLIDENAVFFGGYATSIYAKHMPETQRKWVKQIPDFDVLSENAGECAAKLETVLKNKGVPGVKVVEHDAIGEIIPRHYQIIIAATETICFVFEPIACHSYNKIQMNGYSVNVATIDTMLSLYLAFIYTDKPYFYKERILCMAQYLFEVEQTNRLAQKGVLKRFTMTCVGRQETLIDVREKKAQKFRDLKKGTAEYYEWFLKYNPATDAIPKLEKTAVEEGAIDKSRKSRTRKNKSIAPARHAKQTRKRKT